MRSKVRTTSARIALRRVMAATMAVGASYLAPAQVNAAANADEKRKPYPQVVKVELHLRSSGDSALLLRVRNYRKGNGSFVHAYLDPHAEPRITASRVHGSYQDWRIGPRFKAARKLLSEITDQLLENGVVKFTAGVPAGGPLPGLSSDFRIKGFDEPARALEPADPLAKVALRTRSIIESRPTASALARSGPKPASKCCGATA